MFELFLIAHKVRGEAAFDVAEKMICPHCHGNSACKTCGGSGFTGEHNYGGVCSECGGQSAHGCFDCDSLGYWWIIPTSGHRAWPYWSLALGALMHDTAESFPLILPERTLDVVPMMPSGWPDHYKTLPAPKHDITSLFRSARPHIARRL